MMKIEENEFARVRLLLLREWDPLFVVKRRQYDEEKEDEYNGYAREIAKMLLRGTSFGEVFEYLRWAETKNMELPFSESKARRAAELILKAA
jgi:hypothetical protein